jgi:NADH:ubiquinone oxidoreductase subunit E
MMGFPPVKGRIKMVSLAIHSGQRMSYPSLREGTGEGGERSIKPAEKEHSAMVVGQSLVEVNPDLTPEVLAQVDAIIEQYKDKPGALIPVLEACQEVVGYLPVELQEYIGRRLSIAGSTIYGVVTFYSFFSMVPKGRHTIKICLGTACYVRGTKRIMSALTEKLGLEIGQTTPDRRFSLQAVRCLGACGLAPVMVVDNDTHGGMTMDRVEGILNRYP